MAEKRTLTDAMEKVVTRLISMLDDAGKWTQPWVQMFPGGLHRQVENDKPYTGINQFMLGMTAVEAGYADPRWGTFNLWRKLGGMVLKGEHGTECVYWNFRHYCTECDHKGNDPCGAHPESSYTRGFARFFHLFNRAQVDIEMEDIEYPDNGFTPHERAERFIGSTGIAIVSHDPNRAFYTNARPGQVNVPPREAFTSTEGFYGTVFHELTHATGHNERTGRHDEKDKDGNAMWRGPFGSAPYAAEELVAEIGAAFLAAALRVETDVHPEHAAYVASWRKVLTDEPMVLYRAARAAQTASDWLQSAAAERSEALAS